MQSDNMNYEELHKDIEIKLTEYDEELSKIEQQAESIKIKKQNYIELNQALKKILYDSTSHNLSNSDEKIIERATFTQSEVNSSFFTVETPHGSIEIAINAFKNLEITDAIMKFLRSVNYPQRTSQIVEALIKGGFEMQSAFFSETVRSALRNAAKNPKTGVIWKDKLWQLEDWVVKFSNSSSKKEGESKSNTWKVGATKWSQPVGDAAAVILKDKKQGLHVSQIHRKLAETDIHPTLESLNSALRQDSKKRFERVGPRIYALREKI